MARVVICGGGACGLLMAMLLDEDGHEVVVLERDAALQPDPGDAWESWERRGVNQFRLPHFLLPKFTELLTGALPDVVEDLRAAGAYAVRPRADQGPHRPAAVPRSGARRRGGAAGRHRRPPGCRGRRAAGAGRHGSGPPDVVGVRTGGTVLHADLVIDATGRRSPLPRWLAEIGARAPEEQEEDSGFVYYGRHLRRADGFTGARRPGLRPVRLRSAAGPAGRPRHRRRRHRDLLRRQGDAAPLRRGGLASGCSAHCPAGSGWSTASRSAPCRACRRSRTATAGWWWTVNRWCPAWSRWRTPGRARTRRSAGACRSGCGTRSSCGT